MKVTRAVSRQAKGKMERPYGGFQDRLVQICVREDVTDIKPALQILRQEIHRYNYQQVRSITEEIPYLRFQRALKEKRSLFLEFKITALFNIFSASRNLSFFSSTRAAAAGPALTPPIITSFALTFSRLAFIREPSL